MAAKKSATKKTATKKSPAKESASKKSTSKKSASKKSTSKKSTSKKSTSKKSTSNSPARKRESSSSNGRSTGARAEARPPTRASQVAVSAARDLLELTGKQSEGVTGLERSDDGWTVHIEVVEVRRIPDTTDVLALYEVSTDSHGDLQGYRRVKRYARGVPGDD